MRFQLKEADVFLGISTQQWIGALRALLAWIGGILVGRGYVSETMWQFLLGTAMSGSTILISVLIVHEPISTDALKGFLRNLLATVGGALQSAGVVTGEQVAQITSAVLLVVPALYSVYVHRPQAINAGERGVGGNPAGGGNVAGALVMAAVLLPLCLLLTACNPQKIDASVQAACIAKDAAAEAATLVVNDIGDAQAKKDAARAVAYADAACRAAAAVSAAYARR